MKQVIAQLREKSKAGDMNAIIEITEHHSPDDSDLSDQEGPYGVL